ncbi:glycosyltransferase family 4 protein [Candidatus Peregrinibacteria bacterium]|nr:glycosyltransferase family 4 protein [Candidatus Peregrinibacteria bacterium]
MSVHSLMFGWEYPPIHLGGLGVACQGLVNGLLRHNVKVTLVLPHPNPSSQEGLDILTPTEDELKRIIVRSQLHPYDSVQKYEERIQLISKSGKTEKIYGDDLGQEIENFTAMSVELTKDVQPDLVHCHDWMTYEAGARSAAYHNKPLVAHIHATELDRTHFQPDEWIYKKEQRGFNKADQIVAVSNYTKSILVKHYGISSDKIQVVHNGNAKVQMQRESIIKSVHGQKPAPMVLFLGRMTVQKGPVQFLNMAAEIHKSRPDVQFVLAGDGNMLGELIHRAHDLNLQENIIFAGKVSNSEAQKLFAKADCFVRPSVSEPFGLVALEALAQGTPVVLSKQSGASEVVHNAFKVDFWDTSKMADCVLTILREDALVRQIRSEAPNILQKLTWENQAREIRSLYNKVINF